MQSIYEPNYNDFERYYSVSKSEHTIYSYSKYIRYFFNYFHNEPNTITKRDIDKYVLFIKESGKTGVNITMTIYALKAYFKFLNNMYNNNLDVSIFDDLQKPRSNYRNQKVVEYDQIKKVLRTLKKIKNRFIRIRSIMIILIYATSGARRLEVANLKISDINLNSRYIRFLKTKNNKPRLNPIPDITIKYINKYIRLRRYFALPTNDNLIVSRIDRNAKNARLGIVQGLYWNIKKLYPNFSLHACRRGYATDLYNSGVELAKVSKALGHANYNTTVKHYLCFKDKDLETSISSHPAYKAKPATAQNKPDMIKFADIVQ